MTLASACIGLLHADRTDTLELKEIANEFTARNVRHRCVWEVLILILI